MNATYQISLADYFKSMRLASETYKLWSIFWILFGVVLMFMVFPKYRAGEGIDFQQLLLLAVVPLLIMLLQYGLMFYGGWRHYQDAPYIGVPTTLTVNDDGLEFVFKGHESLCLPWGHMTKWRQNSEYILVYVMPSLFYVIPKRIQETGFNLDKFVNLLQQNLGKPK